MPVVGGKAENICAERVFRILTHLRHPPWPPSSEPRGHEAAEPGCPL